MSASAMSTETFCELHVGDRTYRLCLPNAETDYIQRQIRSERAPYERAMLEDMVARVSTGELVLDVGANVGNHAVFMSVIGGCKVVALEPQSGLCEAMRRSAEENDVSERLSVVQCAAGAQSGYGRFGHTQSDNLGGQSVEVGDGEIKIVPLDSMQFDQPVKLIKIDVEGMELSVLQGARLLITRDRPLLYVECLDERQFREVSAFMAEQGYGYWNTFNASPTHLFIADEQLTVDKRLAHLQSMLEESNYRKGYRLQETSRKLAEANRAYRQACDQIGQFKSQMAELSTDKQMLQVELASVKERLDSANLKYRDVTTQAGQFKMQLTENAAALSAAQEELALARANLVAKDAQIIEVRSSLAMSNALAAQANEHAKTRLEDWQHWERETFARSDAELARLRDEAAEARSRVDDMQARYQTIVAECHLLERKSIALEADLRCASDEQVQAHRQVESLRSEHARVVERADQLLAERAAQATAFRQAQMELEAERNQLRDQSDVLRGQVDHWRDQAVVLQSLKDEQASEIARLHDEQAAGIERLRSEQAAEIARLTEEQEVEIARLHDERTAEFDRLEDEIAVLTAELELLCDVRVRSAEMAAQAEALRQTQATLEEERAALCEQMTSLEERNRQQVDEIARLNREFELLMSKVVGLDEERARNEAEAGRQRKADLARIDELVVEKGQHGERVSNLTTEIEALDDAARQTEAKIAAERAKLHDEIVSLRKSQEQLEADRQQLDSKISVMTADGKARLAAFERTKLDAVRHKLALTEANAQIERLRQQLVAANQQVLRTKDTLSFQLGHALIFGTKSFDGFRALPGKLWAIHKLAKHRRVQKAMKGANHNGAARMQGAHKPIAAPCVEANQRVAEAARAQLQGLHDKDGQQFASRLKEVRVAAIMDEFTHGSFQYECNLLQLTPAHWQSELAAFQPELLFIESAWRGKDELWGSKVGHMSQEVTGIVQWCREHKVPTVFWNKEDPVHFEMFLSTAKLFDFVFTTDIECIHRYKAGLGHDRVYLLPFAAQPRVNNPIEKYARKDAFCFAGAYYLRYPERTHDLGNFIVNLPEFRPVEIYDRNFGKSDPNYQFPDEYRPFIVGNLPYAEIDKAYKGYRYAINLNSIKQSQSMFARRAYELLASNTITVSNYSRGIRLMFGDLIVTSDSGAQIRQRLATLGGDDSGARKFRLAALRKVMGEHTYQDRLAYMIAKVGGQAQPSLAPSILVTGYAKDQAQVDRLLASFGRQCYAHKTLLLVVPTGFTAANLPSDGSVRVLDTAQAATVTVLSLDVRSGWLSVMVPDDYYGEHYLSDLALATRYAETPVIGKTAHFVWSASTGVSLRNVEEAYTRVNGVPARAGLARLDRFAGTTLRDWVKDLYTVQFECEGALAIDEFNYCRNGATMDAYAQVTVDDLQSLDTGLPLRDLLARAEAIEPESRDEDALPQLRCDQLAELFARGPANSAATVLEKNGYLQVDSALPDGTHEYWYATTDHEPAALGATGGKLQLHLETTPGLNLQIAVLFFDEAKQRLGHVVKVANRNHDIDLPAGTAWVRLGLRIYASGSARVVTLLLGHRSQQPAELFGPADNLVLTNHYPSYSDLYRNGFVHSRVRAYRQRGIHCDVFRFRADEAASFHEFEDVDVTTGGAAVLRKALESGRYRTVFVHFLDEPMWAVLREFAQQTKIVVWAHGSDIQAFQRRAFLYDTPEQRQAAMQKSEQRLDLWRDVLGAMPASMHMVFVSRYLAETAMEDLGFRLPEGSYSVLHNPIDTARFNYVQKDAEQRKRVLSIRPYASAVYANDLSVKAILALAQRPFFNEIEFRLIGDGPLFDETLAPLKGMPNVTIERRFLSQAEISDLHKAYGIFLCPTRMDTQGVSRDEAMASGLVPVTNGVAAIPEFVDGQCGVLAAGEDAAGLADGIAQLVQDPELFLRLSAGATARVAGQSAHSTIIDKELALLAA
jgi:FkbM family methyltransferase